MEANGDLIIYIIKTNSMAKKGSLYKCPQNAAGFVVLVLVLVVLLL